MPGGHVAGGAAPPGRALDSWQQNIQKIYQFQIMKRCVQTRARVDGIVILGYFPDIMLDALVVS